MSNIFYKEAVRDALREEMRRDERVFLLGLDIGRFGGTYKATDGLVDEFGEERVRDTPLSEAAIAGAAVGSAMTGLRPVAEIMYIDFTTIAMDQIVNQAAKLRYMSGGQAHIPVVFRTQEGAGRSSAAQHAQSLEAWFAHIPGLKVALPSTPFDAKGLLKTAVRDDGPVMFIEHKLLYNSRGEVPEQEYLIPFGQANICREGSDVTVVALSRMVLRALEAAAELEREGISVEVIDPRTVAPLDIETIVKSVEKTGRLVVAHEAYERCGMGAEIATQVMERGLYFLEKPVRRVCGRNVPVPFAPVMENYVIPGAAEIVKAVKELL
ncbi:MAG TPA: alpha-ketoacid dehydrogenase subunit beta [Bryobacteraceae bacterium]|nr:alpha-ketoacid dehydrogenase subunit beta [Bryobacteraceae bacterium]